MLHAGLSRCVLFVSKEFVDRVVARFTLLSNHKNRSINRV